MTFVVVFSVLIVIALVGAVLEFDILKSEVFFDVHYVFSHWNFYKITVRNTKKPLEEILMCKNDPINIKIANEKGRHIEKIF